MAQIIKHRRGTLAELNEVTLANGEIGIVTGSVTIGDAPIRSAIVVGNTDGTNRLSLARLVQGSGSATLAGKTGGANWNDMLYYDTNDYKLQTLHSTNGVVTLDLTGNIADREIDGTLDVTGRVDAQAGLDVTGSLNVSGDATIGGNLTFGDADTDSISFAADVTSDITPNASDTYNLGSDSQRWDTLYLSGSISASGGPHIIESTTTNIFNSTTTTAITATTTLSAKGNAGASFGDDTGTWEFSGGGALSETGMTTISMTPSSTVDVDAGGAVTIDSSAAISVGGDSVAQKITVGGDTSTRTEVELNAILVDINAGATGVTVDSLDAGSIDIGTSANAASDTSAINIGTSATARTVTIGNAASTAVNANALAITLTSVNALQLTDGAATFQLGGTGATTLSGGTTTDIDGSGDLSLNSTAGAINIGNDAVGQKITVGGETGTRTEVELNAILVDINGGASGVTIDGGAASNFTTSAGALTLNGATGITMQAGGGTVIAVDTNSDVLFSHSGGATGDPDVEFDGYVRFDGITEVANTTTSTTTSTGALIVDGGVGVAENLNVGGNASITGNLTVAGTTTTVDSTVVNIGDNIIVLNAAGATVDSGIQVIDAVSTAHTGSLLWNATNDYWYSGISGSTHYRHPVQSALANLTENRPVIVDGNGRLESSANITDDGSTVNMGVSTHVTGSVFVSTGASVVSGSSVAFQVPSSTQVGYMSSADTSAVTTGLVGYNASTGNLTVSSVIDGGSF
jgi:hypothetical protein